MRQISQNNCQIIILVVVWAIVHGFLFWHFGMRDLFDSAGYVQGADFLLNHGKFEDTHHVFYSVPIVVIAFFRWLFPHQVLPFLIFQCVASGLATWTLFRSGAKVFTNAWAGFSSGILFLAWWDNIHWNTAVMTESLFCSFACILLYQLVCFREKKGQYFVIIFVLVLIFFTRPTGIVLIVGTIAYFLYRHWGMLSVNPVRKYSVIALCVVVASASALIMFTHWDFTDQYKRGNIVTYVDTLEGDSLYHSSLRMNPVDLELAPEEWPTIRKMAYFIHHNPIHFFRTASLKVWYLLTGVRPYYSALHNSYLIAWMAGLYFLSFKGWRRVKEAPVAVYAVSVIVVNCALIAISTIDWDNRFYIPMEPGIVLLAGGGCVAVWDWIRKKNDSGLIDRFG